MNGVRAFLRNMAALADARRVQYMRCKMSFDPCRVQPGCENNCVKGTKGCVEPHEPQHDLEAKCSD